MKIPRKIRNMIISWYQNGNEMEILIFFILICLSDNSFVYHGLSELMLDCFWQRAFARVQLPSNACKLGQAHNTHSPYGYIISVGDFADITWNKWLEPQWLPILTKSQLRQWLVEQ